MPEDVPMRPRRPSKAVLVAATDVAVMVVYLFLITSQSGPQNIPRVAFVASYLVLLALITSGGVLIAASSRTATTSLFIASGVGNISLGVIGIFSIGLPLLIAGLWIMTFADFADLRPRNRRSASGIILMPTAIMVFLFVVGLLSTS
jgi:hypothetical protein